MGQYIQTFTLNQRTTTTTSTISILTLCTLRPQYHIVKHQWLAKGYSEIVVNNQIDKVVFVREQSVKKNLESGIPFITTYHPKVKELRKLIRDLLPFFYSDGEVQKVFSPPPIVSYRSARKIKDCIVRSKLYLVERKIGCRRCGSSRCEVCKSISFCKVIFYSVITKLFLKTRLG